MSAADPAAARIIADKFREKAPWRHPAPLSALVWLYTGAGSELVWVDGELVPAGDQADDMPYLGADDAAVRNPWRPQPAKEVVLAIDRLLPAPKLLLASLHTCDFAPPSDMPALRAPYETPVSHLAGILVACRVLLACAPLVVDPAAAPPLATRIRIQRGLHLSSTASVVRGIVGQVVAAAGLLLENAADRGETAKRKGFEDPALIAE